MCPSANASTGTTGLKTANAVRTLRTSLVHNLSSPPAVRSCPRGTNAVGGQCVTERQLGTKTDEDLSAFTRWQSTQQVQRRSDNRSADTSDRLQRTLQHSRCFIAAICRVDIAHRRLIRTIASSLHCLNSAIDLSRCVSQIRCDAKSIATHSLVFCISKEPDSTTSVATLALINRLQCLQA